MPGPQVKNWPQYEALRGQGKSKESAARITNASAARGGKVNPKMEALKGLKAKAAKKRKKKVAKKMPFPPARGKIGAGPPMMAAAPPAVGRGRPY